MSSLTIQSRTPYLDGLRIFATAAVFLFHCVHVFDNVPFLVNNAETSPVFMIIASFMFFWIMPLFFLLAGMAAYNSVKSRTNKAFIKERFFRLVIPYLAGVILLTPPQKYAEAVSYRQFHGSFLKFLPWLINNFGTIYPNPVLFGQFGYHLWFLAFLFLFSLMALPLFRFWQSEQGSLFLTGLKIFLARKGSLFITIIPILIIYPFLKPLSPWYSSWVDFFYWFYFFLLGFVIFSSEQLKKQIKKIRYVFLGLGLISFTLMGVIISKVGTKYFDFPDYSVSCLLGISVWVLTAWSWTLFFLGAGQKILTSNPAKRIQSGTMPFYLIHQPVIIISAFFIVQLSWNIYLKFLVLFFLSLLVTLIISEGFIRNIKLLRLLFGMKIKRI